MVRREDPTRGIELFAASMEDSDYIVAAQKIQQIDGQKVTVEKTEAQILSEIRRSLPIHYWNLQHGYNDRKPRDAWELTVGEQVTPLYNYAKDVELREEQIQEITVHLALFAMHFGEFVPQLGAITITDHLSENLTRDGAFKRHAEAQPAAGMFALTPRTFEEGIYRPELPVNRIGAVVLHELVHFEMDTALSNGWPKDRVTSYSARFGRVEDIPESAVAYLLHTGQLSTEKKDRLSQHDHWLSRPNMLYEHVPDLPLPKSPDVIRYYVDETAVDGL